MHLRSAQKLLKLCCKNGGVFIKVGQHVGSLDYLLPKEYVATLKVLHDKAPESSKSQVLQVLKEEFGDEVSCCNKSPAGLMPRYADTKAILSTTQLLIPLVSPIQVLDNFVSFDDKPIGTASLAQVHKAQLKDGTTVAVKVQHAKVKAHSFIDMNTMEIGRAHV